MILIHYNCQIGEHNCPTIAQALDFRVEPHDYRDNENNPDAPPHLREAVTRTTFWICATTMQYGRPLDTAVKEYATLDEAGEAMNSIGMALESGWAIYHFKGGDQFVGRDGDSQTGGQPGAGDDTDRTPTIVRDDG